MTFRPATGEEDLMDRRAFFKRMPRYLVSRFRGLFAEDPESANPGRRDAAARRRVAVLDVSRCLAWGAGECQLCYLRCPLRGEAVLLEGSRPVVVASACNGCGVCVEACRAVNDLGAIEMASV